MSSEKDQWKTQIYIVGVIGGGVLGFLSAYLFARAAEEDVARNGDKPRISTGQMIGLMLTALGLIRQISEAGRPPKK
jgi:hypothetical protein